MEVKITELLELKPYFQTNVKEQKQEDVEKVIKYKDGEVIIRRFNLPSYIVHKESFILLEIIRNPNNKPMYLLIDTYHKFTIYFLTVNEVEGYFYGINLIDINKQKLKFNEETGKLKTTEETFALEIFKNKIDLLLYLTEELDSTINVYLTDIEYLDERMLNDLEDVINLI